MASLVEQNGYYYAQFYESSRSPRRKKVPLKTKRKRPARRLLGRMEDRYATGEYDPWTDGRQHELFGWEPEPSRNLSTLGAAREAFLEDRSHLRPETIRTYEEVLRLFVGFHGKSASVRSLKASDIEAWISSTDELADATKRKYVKHVGYLVRYLIEEGWMEEDITKEVDLPKAVEQPPRALTQKHQRKLIQAIQAHHQSGARDGRCNTYPELLLLVRLNPLMGLRANELIHLRWKDRASESGMTVDLEAKTAHITNTAEFTTKPGRGRTLPLPDRAVRLLEQASEHRLEGCPYVYHTGGEKLKYSALSHAFCRFRKAASLPDWVQIHSTRHAYATRLARAGTPINVISRFMGHSSTAVTEQYMHASPKQGHRHVNDAFGS